MKPKRFVIGVILGLIVTFSVLADQGDKILSDLIAEKRFEEATQRLKQQLNLQPDNQFLRFQMARLLAWQGNYVQSIAEFNKLLTVDADNSDYLLGMAQSLTWSGQPDQAVIFLDKAIAIKPDYEALWQAKINALNQSKSQDSKKNMQVMLSIVKTRFPEAEWLDQFKVQTVEAMSYTAVIVNSSYDKLDNNFQNWSSVGFAAEHEFISKTKVYGGINLTRQFDLSDEEYSVGIYQPIMEQWGVVVELNASPSHHVRPKRSLFAQIQHQLGDGWLGAFSLRNTEYEETVSKSMGILLERYWQVYRMGYTLLSTDISGEAITADVHYTHLVSADYYYHNTSSIGFVATVGEELEYNGTSNPPISAINAILIRGRHWLNAQWYLNYDWHYHEQGDIYTRNGLMLGLGYRY